MFRLHALPLAVAILGSASVVKAEASYSLTYRSAEGCPTREHFVAELGLRSQGLREATNEAPDVGIEIWFEGNEPTNGILLLRDSEGHPTLRTIPGATCAEVVAALALTASVLIDAQLRAIEAPAVSAVPPPYVASSCAVSGRTRRSLSLRWNSSPWRGGSVPATR